MFNDFHHNKRHDDRADVRNGLGEDQTVQTDQSVGDEQYRQENESLAADGQDQRCQTVSHALESVVVHEDNAQERSGDHQRPEHLHGVVLLGDNICRRAGRAGGHKDADDRLSEQEVQRRQNQPQHQGADHAEPYHFCHLGEVPCAVVESHQRLDADTDAQLDEHYQHICFHGDAHAAGGENVDVIQQPVQHQVGQAHQHISEKHGDADGEHAAENAAFHGEVLRIRGEHGAADFQIDEVEQRCHRVADAGGDGCTLDAHAHGKDHDGVQDDVQQCTSDLRNGGKIGSAGPLQKALINRIANAAERADTADSQILLPHFLAECIPVRLHSDERSGSENAEQKKNRINTVFISKIARGK